MTFILTMLGAGPTFADGIYAEDKIENNEVEL